MIHAGGPRPEAGGRGRRGATRPERARRGERQNAKGTKPRRQERGRDPHGARRGAQRAQKGGPKAARPAPPPWSAQATPRRGPDGGDPAHPPARPRARSLTTRAQAHTATHPRSRGKGGRSRRVSGRAPCHGKAGVLRAGGVAGSLRARAARASQDPWQAAGMGPRRLPRAQARRMGRTPKKPARPPKSCCGGTRAGGTGARARAAHTKRQKAQRKCPPSGAHKCNEAIITIKNRAGSLRLRPCYGIM